MDERGIRNEDEIAALRARIDAARDRVTEALTELDDIEMHQNVRIEADYAAKIGCHENDELRSEVDLRRAMRMAALFDEAAKGRAMLDAHAIEQQVSDEFAAWNVRVQTEVSRCHRLLRRARELNQVPAAEAVRQKELYREIVRRLHPEVHDGTTPDERIVFLAAQMAFGSNDGEALRALEEKTRNLVDAGEVAVDTGMREADTLHAEAAMMEATAAHFEANVADLKKRFPYCLSEQLQDAPWVSQRVESIDRLTQQNRQLAAVYEARCWGVV